MFSSGTASLAYRFDIDYTQYPLDRGLVDSGWTIMADCLVPQFELVKQNTAVTSRLYFLQKCFPYLQHASQCYTDCWLARMSSSDVISSGSSTPPV
ncbi:hypothetical protein AVEN_236291-1 [Araneus ventricosus]|uniref:Uncharacterized protein n=1 Tax=Araneus ventricosus TaxID=182803 RepID=A0A4Y2C955_ARAVE|nr:hypothetical protein AVEN_190389-1 [Araneus ventricosus]GBM00293.1 hypothetical protein AVEN_236291-1 [Araneus ventricosus]